MNNYIIEVIIQQFNFSFVYPRLCFINWFHVTESSKTLPNIIIIIYKQNFVMADIVTPWLCDTVTLWHTVTPLLCDTATPWHRYSVTGGDTIDPWQSYTIWYVTLWHCYNSGWHRYSGTLLHCDTITLWYHYSSTLWHRDTVTPFLSTLWNGYSVTQSKQDRLPSFLYKNL